MAAYGQWIVSHAKLVVALCIVLAVIASAGIGRLTSTPDNRVFFGKDNPQLKQLEALENTYSRTDNIFIAMSPVSGTIATPQFLVMIDEITEAAWQIPYSSRVDSLANFQNISADGDDLAVAELISTADPITAADADKIVDTALQKEFLVNRLISTDAKVTGVNITLLKPEDNDNAVHEIDTYTDNLVADFATRYPSVFHCELSGQHCR